MAFAKAPPFLRTCGEVEPALRLVAFFRRHQNPVYQAAPTSGGLELGRPAGLGLRCPRVSLTYRGPDQTLRRVVRRGQCRGQATLWVPAWSSGREGESE